MAASGCDLNGRTIPLPITMLGTAIGLVGSVLMPWPWPWEAQAAMPQAGALGMGNDAWVTGRGLGVGVQPWPVWGPLPAWLPAGSWQLGLATGLGGMLVGTLMLRSVAFLFGSALGKEGLGLGDADLMMMVGAFLGWQIVVVAFFVGALWALPIAILQLAINKDNASPFGPSLAAGTMMTLLCWTWIGPRVQFVFFWDVIVVAMAGLGAIILVVCGLTMRLLQSLTARA
jgi:leader peptidase (prepilin peptidase)/N-methyltransferase